VQTIAPDNVFRIITSLERRSFLVHPFYLLFHRFEFEELPGDLLVFYDRDSLLFPSRQPENMLHKKIWCFADDIERLRREKVEIRSVTPDAIEYFYATQNFIEPKGKKFRHQRTRVRHFQKTYSFSLRESYDPSLVNQFLDQWHAAIVNKKSPTVRSTFEREFELSRYILDNFSLVPSAQALYVELEEKLIGLCVFLPLYNDLWVSVIQKTMPVYRGISDFLHYEAARRMNNIPICNFGDDAMDPALATHKRELRPIRTEQHFLVETGGWD
jgi:hypothetical protein